MRKTVIILSVFWLIAGSYGQAAKKRESSSVPDVNEVTELKQSIPEKWYGTYSFFIMNGDSEDWREMQGIELRIDKDTVTFTAEGYQLYQYYLLNVRGNDNELRFTYSEAIDDSFESAVLEKTKDFGTLIFDGKNYLWNCPYIDISFGDDKQETYILGKTDL
jgi:hypothetical protein